MPRYRFLCLIVALCTISGAAMAAPVASDWVDEEQTSVRLIAATDGLGSDGTVRAGIEFQMKPGWKVYWRSPGDAGFPPIPDFTGSENATPSALSWPAPHRFSVLGLETLGYKDTVVLPFTVRADDPTKPATIKAQVRYLTCNDICIPYEAALSMTVPPGGQQLTPLAHTINKFVSQVPEPGDPTRLDLAALTTETSGETVSLVANLVSALPLNKPDLFVESATDYTFGAPEVRLGADGTQATLRVGVHGYKASAPDIVAALTKAPLTLTIVDDQRAVEVQRTPSVGTQQQDVPSAGPAILTMLAFAFLGGLILNLMPCVLPVLSIKLMGAIKLGGGQTCDIRIGFLASAAGIVFGFAILAAAMIALKTAGAGIGWGIQFQQPWFLIAMALTVTLFACNMWGLFEFRLPGAVADAALAGSKRDGHVGHFLQGIFATLLATPCSAPFLGTAVAFALSRGASEIAAIFAMLGIGLATPYLLVAAFPRLAAILPKPGPWMNVLRVVLGVALLGTAAWLAYVLAGVTTQTVGIVTAAALALLILWFAIRKSMWTAAPQLTAPLVVLLAAVPLAYAYQAAPEARSEKATATVIDWQPLDLARIDTLVADGKTVFVDVTADWCITCAVNKRLVLETDAIGKLLNGPDVVAMQGDWTRPDPMIADYLASFGRFGIPFNAVYGKGAPKGVALPELLSTNDVLAGFKTASPAPLAKVSN